jgi:ribose transport system substrate-binding protein
MKRLKKTVLIIVAVVLAINSSACVMQSNNTEIVSKKENIVIRWMLYGEKAKSSDTIIAEFNSMIQEYYPDTTVEFEYVPKEQYKAKWDMKMATDEAVDMVWIGNDLFNYSDEVKKGSFIALDYLLNTYGKVYAATDVENQIQQADDLLSNTDKLAGIVILPYDNGLQATLEKIAKAEVPFVQFDRVINSDIIDVAVVANVKGDNEGIGYETAKRFIEKGLTKNDYVYEMIGDNSSVPELRSNGFRAYLTEQGWTDEEIEGVVIKSAATGWSRDTGKELFESWFSSSQCDSSKNNWIFTHDDEIAMGVLESLNGSALDEGKKNEFLGTFQALASSSGLAEIYAVLGDTHKTINLPETFDMFSVTYDPAMIQEAKVLFLFHIKCQKYLK